MVAHQSGQWSRLQVEMGPGTKKTKCQIKDVGRETIVGVVAEVGHIEIDLESKINRLVCKHIPCYAESTILGVVSLGELCIPAH